MCFIIPPYVLESILSRSSDLRLSSNDLEMETSARQSLHLSNVINKKMAYQGIRNLFGKKLTNTEGKKNRRVYNAENSTDTGTLPGKFVLSDSQGSSDDIDVLAVYANAGIVWNFYHDILKTDSIDGKGADLILSCHFGNRYDNAYFGSGSQGDQMVFGDGDGRAFRSLHQDLMVTGHEMTHGWIDHHPRWIYKGESGALNESLADCMGIAIEQWYRKTTPKTARWYVGAEVIGPASGAKGLRSFTDEPAFVNDRLFGTDDQPKHMSKFVRTTEDNGGVHTNSGIPNRAFYELCMTSPGMTWEEPIQIWHQAALKSWFFYNFEQFARKTLEAANDLYGPMAMDRTRAAWAKVGICL